MRDSISTFLRHAVSSRLYSESPQFFTRRTCVSSRLQSEKLEPTCLNSEHIMLSIDDIPDKIIAKLFAPKFFNITILPFQKQGVGWMVRKELTGHGGILADHLGLGKTVQMIALMLLNPLRLMQTDRSFADEIIESAGSMCVSRLQRMSTVCRLLYKLPGIGDCSRLLQPDMNLFELAVHIDDRVQALVRGTLKNEEEVTAECSQRVRRWLEYSKRFYANYERKCTMFIESSTEAASTAGVGAVPPVQTPELRTLVIVPTSLLSQWRSEIQRCVASSHALRVCTYHGPQRTALVAATLEQYDVVLTTYDVLWHDAHEFLRALESGEQRTTRPVTSTEMRERIDADRRSGDAMVFERSKCGPLFSIVWKRVVLDEAHVIRNQHTQRWRAVNELLAVKRWCITATPMQNDLSDLQTLLRFVHSPPLPIPSKMDSSQLLRDRALQEAIARSLRDVVLRREPVMSRLVPVPAGSASRASRKARHFVKEKVSLLKLPPKIEHIELISLREGEADLYNSLIVRARQIANLDDGQSVQYLVLLMRLRQVCCHPWLVEHVELSSSEILCEECKCVAETPVHLSCGHSICRACATNAFADADERRARNNPEENLPLSARTMLSETTCVPKVTPNAPSAMRCEVERHESAAIRLKCPRSGCTGFLFREALAGPASSEAYRRKFTEKPFMSSAKVDRLLSLLRGIWQKSPSDKVVVFTHFVSFMAILEIALARERINFLSISGSLSVAERAGVVSSFYEDPTLRVLLASKIACGAGLNLTVANHVIVLDPWWNPGIEEQAVHRCHRIGQTKPVHIYRCITENSIEFMCWQIASKKKSIGDHVFHSEDDPNKSECNDIVESLRKNIFDLL